MKDFMTTITLITAVLSSPSLSVLVSKFLEQFPEWHNKSPLFKFLASTVLTSTGAIVGYFLASSPEVAALPANNPLLATTIVAVTWLFTQWWHSRFKDTPGQG